MNGKGGTRESTSFSRLPPRYLIKVDDLLLKANECLQ